MSNRKRQYPPHIEEKLLRLLLPESEKLSLLGDYEELYKDLVQRRGRMIANLWYWIQILITTLNVVLDSTKWSSIMVRNYLKIAWRNLHRNKMVSFINITGLALGMACFMLILFWVQDELSYDTFHTYANNLYRVTEQQTFSNQTNHVARTPAALAPALSQEIPEIANAMRFFKAPSLLVTHDTKRFYEPGIAFASPSILSMFTFPMTEGNPKSALKNVSSIVITEKMAEKYFGNENPINKTLTINNQHDFIISGIIQNIPRNSQLRFDFLLPFPALEYMRQDVGIRWQGVLDNWGINFYYTYVQVIESADKSIVEEKIVNFIQEHYGIKSITLFLQPMLKIHLHSNLMGDFKDNGNITTIYIFSIIAFFILLIACINFMNLTTAQFTKRAKEVGMRKIIGASRQRIIQQFLGESMLLSLIAFLIAIFLVITFLPRLNHLSGKEITFSITSNVTILAGIILTFLFTGFASGIYPAFLLSVFQPVHAIKPTMRSGPKNRTFRRLLVVFQFSTSIALIIATLTVHRQLDFIQNSKLGFDREHVVYLRLRGNTAQYYDLLKNQLTQNANILGVTAADQLPTQIRYSLTGADWQGKNSDEDILMNFICVDFDFTETLHIDIADGRSFSNKFPSDRTSAFILNQKAAQIMGKKNPVGESFAFFGRQGKIIGIINDFQFETFYHEVKPLVLLYSGPRNDHYVMIRIPGKNIAEHIKFIEETWKKAIPDYPFDYHFLDENFNVQYRKEQQMKLLFNDFTALTIVIAFLGLFGLISFEAERRRKEIGIRKTLGASVPHIVSILVKELMILIAVANVIAWPMAYFFMNKWLQNFALRTTFGIWIFIISGSAALCIAIITISFQTVKAAIANPVEALRYE